jgi:uncharacterized integral membrane protein (TIGR00697 family)
VIWAGFGAMLFATFMSQVVLRMPPDPGEPYNEIVQPSLEVLFSGTWRIIAASVVAFWLGDFANSYVMARMKVATSGRFLWVRTIGSTVIGLGVDSLVFYPIAFYGLWANGVMVSVVLFKWFFKVMVEVAMTPVTYKVVSALKRAEGEDYYDRDTNFTPFSLKV